MIIWVLHSFERGDPWNDFEMPVEIKHFCDELNTLTDVIRNVASTTPVRNVEVVWSQLVEEFGMFIIFYSFAPKRAMGPRFATLLL